MKYFILCFLLTVSCKSAIKDTGKPDVVIGKAVNEKAGAGGAAEVLDIPGNTLHSKMKKLDITKADYFT